MVSSLQIESNFLLTSLRFDGETLSISLGSGSGREDGNISFGYVRSFLVFKEGDFWREIAKYRLEPVLSVYAERTLGVFRVISSSLLESIAGDRFLEEAPTYYWVSTPDECLEVVCFEAPTIVGFRPTDGEHEAGGSHRRQSAGKGGARLSG